MTNYNDWDKKAEELAKQAEEEDEKEKKAADEALGLQDGPQGPPTEKARQQKEEMKGHSDNRQKFIDRQERMEKVLTHTEPSDEEIVLTGEDENYKGKAVRIRGSKGCSYKLCAGVELLKLFIENCTDVKVRVCCRVQTSFMEVVRCSNTEIRIESVMQMTQCDELNKGPVSIIFTEPETIGDFFHQNCPSLEVYCPGVPVQKFGKAVEAQFCSKHLASGEYVTEGVRRGEKDFPMQLGVPVNTDPEPDAEVPPTDETSRLEAEAKREEGNQAFRSSDFLQAAVHYTEAIKLCETLHLAWANRAQCFLRTGDLDRALKDATRCTELAPDYAKGWFRKGMAYHAQERHAMAIKDLLVAEKLDPKSPQIQEAIKMAQMMARKNGPGEVD